MILTCKPSQPNARRISRLTFESCTFEEERILQALFDVMDFGGSIEMKINEQGAFPARDVTCDFAGEKNHGA